MPSFSSHNSLTVTKLVDVKFVSLPVTELISSVSDLHEKRSGSGSLLSKVKESCACVNVLLYFFFLSSVFLYFFFKYICDLHKKRSGSERMGAFSAKLMSLVLVNQSREERPN